MMSSRGVTGINYFDVYLHWFSWYHDLIHHFGEENRSKIPFRYQVVNQRITAS